MVLFREGRVVMKRIKMLCVALAFFTLAAVAGCGGGSGTSDGGTAAPSISDEGTVVSLKDGGFVGTSESGVYFPPQDIDASIKVIVSGSGESESDHLSVDFSFTDANGEIKTAKSDTAASTGIIFNTVLVLNKTTTQTPGTYGSISGILFEGESMYSCSEVYPSGSTNVEGAILGPYGKQYVGCVKGDFFDEFKASFYIDSDSVIDVTNDLEANIKVLGPLCWDMDCGDLAEPIDMMDLYAAYMDLYNNMGKPDAVIPRWSVQLINSHVNFSNTFLIGEIRRLAYESMLFELFTQKYLWEDYQSEIEKYSEEKIGLPELVRTITEYVNKTFEASSYGSGFLRLTPDVIRGIRDVLGSSKYATFKNVLNRVDKYLLWLSYGGAFTLDVEEGVFEWFLYQLLGDAFTENYIEAFEKDILPNVKDPELKTAFINTKKKIVGTNPDGSDGLLHNDVMKIWEAFKDTGFAITYDFLKISLGVALQKYITTGLGTAALASGGILAFAGPAVLAGVVVAALDDGVRFSTMDAPMLIALATFMNNNYSAFDLFDEECPTSDSENENLLAAQNIFYSARLFFALLKDNYDRWFVEASSLRQDDYQLIFALSGLGSDGAVWTLPRKEQVSKGETKYAAKAVKAMEMLFTCDKYCPASGETCTHLCTTGQTRCEAGNIYNCITGSSGCRVWDSGTACATGLCAADGLQCDSCTNVCSIGEVKCSAGKSYTCTANASGCRVWDEGTACPAGACSDATHCAGGCTPYHHNACYDHDVYSYDSCNVPESKVTECGVSDWTGTTGCSSGDVYQNFVTKDCSGTACTASTESKMKQDCGDAGCLGGACCGSHASYRCNSDDVYWYSSCDARQDKKQECGSSTPVGSNYCYDNDVYKDYDVGGCTTDHCTTTRQPEKQTECGTGGCIGGLCCVSNLTKQCYNGDVYWYDSCGRLEGIAADCDITQTCSAAKCVCAASAPWTSNALTASVVTGGVSLSWNPAPSSWIHHYKVARAAGATTPPPGLAISSDLTATSWVDKTGVKGQQYIYVVYGYDACGVNRNVSTMLTQVFP